MIPGVMYRKTVQLSISLDGFTIQHQLTPTAPFELLRDCHGSKRGDSAIVVAGPALPGNRPFRFTTPHDPRMSDTGFVDWTPNARWRPKTSTSFVVYNHRSLSRLMGSFFSYVAASAATTRTHLLVFVRPPSNINTVESGTLDFFSSSSAAGLQLSHLPFNHFTSFDFTSNAFICRPVNNKQLASTSQLHDLSLYANVSNSPYPIHFNN